MLDVGTDPRELERELEREQAEAKAEAMAAAKAEAQALAVAQAALQVAAAVTVADALGRYIAEGSSKRRDNWEPRYIADTAKMAAPGGERKKRGQGLTLPGHLAPLLALNLSDIDEDRLTAWFNVKCSRSKHQATRALMMFRAFLSWCASQPEYRALVDRDAGKAPAIMDKLPETALWHPVAMMMLLFGAAAA